MKMAVGSFNPAKVEAVRTIFDKEDVVTMKVDSGVSDQPFSDEETIDGAINRAKNCLNGSDAELAIGLEGGVVDTKYGMFVCNWGALVTRKNEVFIAGGARVLLPDGIAKRLRTGEELGPVMDDFTQSSNIRKKEGAIGIFTNNRVTRAEMFQHIVHMLAGQYEYNECNDIKDGGRGHLTIETSEEKLADEEAEMMTIVNSVSQENEKT